MFNLRDASEGLRKAAAMVGIKSGKYEPVFDPQSNGTSDSIVARVFNRFNPNGVEFTDGEVRNAQDYTWREIDR